jgi:hypothetical protein
MSTWPRWPRWPSPRWIELILAGLHFERVSATLAQGMEIEEIETSSPAAVIEHELAQVERFELA